MNDAIKSIPLRVLADAETMTPGVKQLGQDKIARSPVKFDAAPTLRKPEWIRVR
ncbi:MAG TPA: lipoyl synthase, partial [Xanthomonadaceae bacterium]|nr:lipoyl synthase [Xanthomonadaceae bacterium]